MLPSELFNLNSLLHVLQLVISMRLIRQATGRHSASHSSILWPMNYETWTMDCAVNLRIIYSAVLSRIARVSALALQTRGDAYIQARAGAMTIYWYSCFSSCQNRCAAGSHTARTGRETIHQPAQTGHGTVQDTVPFPPCNGTLWGLCWLQHSVCTTL